VIAFLSPRLSHFASGCIILGRFEATRRGKDKKGRSIRSPDGGLVGTSVGWLNYPRNTRGLSEEERAQKPINCAKLVSFNVEAPKLVKFREKGICWLQEEVDAYGTKL